MSEEGEIVMIPFQGQGHLFPFSELCKHLLARNYKITLIIPSSLTSSISSSLLHHPFLQITQLPISPRPPPPPPGYDPHHQHHHDDASQSQHLADLLSHQSNKNQDHVPPVCAVVDTMMGWAHETCRRFNIPVVSFFTSGACSTAMEYALWKLQLQRENMNPDDNFTVPGLPVDMHLKLSDLTHRPPPPPPPHSGDSPTGGPLPPQGPPPRPGQQPPWVSQADGSIVLLINTCDVLERPFIDYVAKEIGKPVRGVGPLLPDQYWKSSDSLIHDHDVRFNNRRSDNNITEEKVNQWLDSRPRRSVIYVAFGTEVVPTVDEMAKLADALAESNQPFIWALQSNSGRPPPMTHGSPGGPTGGPPEPHGSLGPSGSAGARDFFPEDLASRARDRGLIIRGWAPQLLILSHPSTAGFVSHCGWNSTLEAIGRGVPILAWPIRGDQIYNAKLVVNHLRVGLMIESNDGNAAIKKDDILGGIEKLIADDEIRQQAESVRARFSHGFPASSMASLDEFQRIIKKKILA